MRVLTFDGATGLQRNAHLFMPAALQNEGAAMPASPAANDQHFEDAQDSDDLAEPEHVPADLAQPLAEPQLVPLYGNADEWLLRVCQTSCAADGSELAVVHVLEYTADGIVRLIMPAYNPQHRLVGCKAVREPGQRQHESRLNPFCFLQLRCITFADGMVMCCDCSNPGCSRGSADKALFAAEFLMPVQPHRTRDTALGTSAPLCNCANAAICAVFGQVGSLDRDADRSFCSWYAQHEPFGAPLVLHRACVTCMCDDRLCSARRLASHELLACHVRCTNTHHRSGHSMVHKVALRTQQLRLTADKLSIEALFDGRTYRVMHALLQ